MNLLPVCILYTQDPDLARRVNGYLKFLAVIRRVDRSSNLETVLQQHDPALLLMDLRSDDWRTLLLRIAKNLPQTVVIALGSSRSDPALEAESVGVYAIEDPDVDRQRMQSLVTRAQVHLSLIRENQMLKKSPPQAPPEQQVAGLKGSQPEMASMQLHHFSRAFRHFDNVEALLENMVEGVASCARVSRVGVFSVAHGSNKYCLRAGIKCLDNTCDLEFAEEDPVARWMQINAHLVARSSLHHITDSSERMLLLQALDALGAEVIVPLHGRERVIGWLFVGHHVTGVPFEQSDLEGLVLLAEHMSITLENALLYEKVAVQKTLADTVLESIPVGIVTVTADGTVGWLNRAAEMILEIPTGSVLKQPAVKLGGRLADLLERGLRDEPAKEPVEWVDPLTKRSLSVITRRLVSNDCCLGAVGIIHDLTHDRLVHEERDHVERAAFWTELAAAISHEVRNPLVAISTFAQLLPERYADPEFRDQFSRLVTQEVGRLNGMVEQINAFAHQPELVFKPLDVEVVLKKAVQRVLQQFPANNIEMKSSTEKGLPKMEGDEAALVECFGHLIVNAKEALKHSEKPLILIDLSRNGCDLLVSVKDNGDGIPSDIKDKVFSPFCTTKPRGIGLGLPIVRRTVADHKGTVTIETNDKGTHVSVALPVNHPGQGVSGETHTRGG